MQSVRLAVVCTFMLMGACNKSSVLKKDQPKERDTHTDSDSDSDSDSTRQETDSDPDASVSGTEGSQCIEEEDSDTGSILTDTDSATDTDSVGTHDTDSATDTKDMDSATISDGGEDDEGGDTVSETDDVETNGSDWPSDADSETTSDTVDDCPGDMVPVLLTTDPDAGDSQSFCIDRYEASRQDADASSVGQDNSIATSRKGVMSWVVNPMTDEALLQFKAACKAAGKRLCTSDEWHSSCAGPDNLQYVFGDAFDRETCNCVDTFCDDYCSEHDISDDDCYVSANCGYRCGSTDENEVCYRAMPTGSFADCTNEYGTLDINGNLWEIVTSKTDSRGYEIRGGAFNCASASARLRCTYNADWQALYAGFRCCGDVVK